jgi:hypothetical protein
MLALSLLQMLHMACTAAARKSWSWLLLLLSLTSERSTPVLTARCLTCAPPPLQMVLKATAARCSTPGSWLLLRSCQGLHSAGRPLLDARV